MSKRNALRGFLMATVMLLMVPVVPVSVASGLLLQPPNDSLRERMVFEHLSVEEGLSQVTVEAILQDRQGFMWFGTQDGLSRWDGYDFRVYRPEPGNPHSLSGSFVTALYEDADGTLWVGTEKGLNRFGRWGGSFKRYTHDAGDLKSIGGVHVTAIAEGPDGKLWIGTRKGGLSRLDDPESGTFTRFQTDPERPQSLASNTVLELRQGSEGQLWVGTPEGLDRLEPAADGAFEHVLSGFAVGALYEEPNGRLWLGTADKRGRAGDLMRYDTRTGNTRKYNLGTGDGAYITSISVNDSFSQRSNFGREGSLWVGTLGSGLVLFNPKTGEFTRYTHDSGDSESLAGDEVTAVLEGHFGTLWVGTARNGVSSAERHATTFKHYQHQPGTPESSLSDDVVYSIYKDESSILWVGTLGGGLNRLDRKAGTVEHYRHEAGNDRSVSGDNILAITEDARGQLWVGTMEGGLDRLDRGTEAFVNYPLGKEGERHSVGALHKGEDGTLWVGTNNGLFHFDPSAGIVLEAYPPDSEGPKNPQSLNGNSIVEISAAQGGRLWIGTSQNGLALFEPRTGRVVRRFRHDPSDPNSLGSDYVSAVHPGRVGHVWVATYGGGLGRLDPDAPDKGFVRYTEQNSALPSNTIAGLLEDDAGTLWISTYAGLVQMDPVRETFRTYGSDRGVQSSEFNLTAYHEGPGGEMFFGGVNGLNAFYPEDVEVNSRPPAVVLTSATLRTWPVREDSTLRLRAASTVSLQHDQNDFFLEYVGLHYAAPERNVYAYRLEGYDADWQHVGTRRQAIYTNLDPGDYTFRVKAANRDGVWSEEHSLLAFTIQPPWWDTWGAYGTYMLVLMLIALAGARWQQRRLLRRERARIAKAENERKTQELEEARQLQLSMLPKATPAMPHAEIAARMRTATEVGGDYYDFRRTSGGALLFAIGDATGHGARAGTMVAVTKTLFNSLSDVQDDPKDGALACFLQRAAGVLRRLGMPRLYMSLALGRLTGHRLELAGAGLPPALVYRAVHSAVEEVTLKGIPLGGPPGFPYRQQTLELAPGDVVVLMSDGFPESFDAERRMLGYERAAAVLRESATDSPEEIITSYEEVVRRWTGDSPLSDDMTFIVIKMRTA